MLRMQKPRYAWTTATSEQQKEKIVCSLKCNLCSLRLIRIAVSANVILYLTPYQQQTETDYMYCCSCSRAIRCFDQC